MDFRPQLSKKRENFTEYIYSSIRQNYRNISPFYLDSFHPYVIVTGAAPSDMKKKQGFGAKRENFEEQ